MKRTRGVALAAVALAAAAATAPAQAAGRWPGFPSLGGPSSGGGLVRITAGDLVSGVDRPGDERAIEGAVRHQLSVEPGGLVDGRTITYKDGSVFIAVADGRDSSSLCSANRFCAFTDSYERGSVVQYGKLGPHRQWSYSGSYLNRRTRHTDVLSASGRHRHRVAPANSLDQVGTGFHAGVLISLRGF